MNAILLFGNRRQCPGPHSSMFGSEWWEERGVVFHSLRNSIHLEIWFVSILTVNQGRALLVQRALCAQSPTLILHLHRIEYYWIDLFGLIATWEELGLGNHTCTALEVSLRISTCRLNPGLTFVTRRQAHSSFIKRWWPRPCPIQTFVLLILWST